MCALRTTGLSVEDCFRIADHPPGARVALLQVARYAAKWICFQMDRHPPTICNRVGDPRSGDSARQDTANQQSHIHRNTHCFISRCDWLCGEVLLPLDELDLGIGLTQVVKEAGGRVLQVHVEERMHVGCGDRESTAAVKPPLEKLQQLDDIVAL